MTATTLLPVHDHFESAAPPRHVDLYFHDPRCPGECGPCAGHGSVPGNIAMSCLYCGGTGQCSGCNAYLTHEARERGMAV